MPGPRLYTHEFQSGPRCESCALDVHHWTTRGDETFAGAGVTLRRWRCVCDCGSCPARSVAVAATGRRG